MYIYRLSVSRVLICIAALAQFGCASMTGQVSYPASWPDLDRTQVANGCPNISGTFQNRPSEAWPVPTSDSPTLTNLFFGLAHGRKIDAPSTTVSTWHFSADEITSTLRLEPERLDVIFTAKDGIASSVSFRRYHFDIGEKIFDDLFTCYPGTSSARLRFFAEPESHSSSGMLYAEAGGTLVFLLKAIDGSLIIQLRSESLKISTLILGSRMAFNSIWLRFSPIASE